ncbi:hypothetical protein D6829_02155 [Candidatus Pacearchaeota archaeon]|nr:MAG: hypothetical protein D6829_02155 [Candidatus Pacearchaeota archaeon]
MHIKRNRAPTKWPIPRKGSTFVVRPSHALSKGIPLLIVLRDVLKIARIRKEVKYMLTNGMVLVNSKERKDEKFPLQLFDTLTLKNSNQNFRLEVVNRKFQLVEIKKEEASKKIVKVIGKKILKNKKVQINLDDGHNFLTKHKFSVGDSAVIDLAKGKVERILPLKKGAQVEVIGGKHAGERGELIKVEELKRGRMYVIKIGEKEVKLPLKTLLVIG